MRHHMDDLFMINNSRIDIFFDSDNHVYYVVVALINKDPFEICFTDLNEANKFAFAFVRSYNQLYMNIYFS